MTTHTGPLHGTHVWTGESCWQVNHGTTKCANCGRKK